MSWSHPNASSLLYFVDTYIFEESLHECEPDVICDPACVCSKDMLLIARREFLGFFASAAVPQHWKATAESET